MTEMPKGHTPLHRCMDTDHCPHEQRTVTPEETVAAMEIEEQQRREPEP